MMSEPTTDTDFDSDVPTYETMACPDCGTTKFSWILRQVQFGTVHRFDNGRFSEEGLKMGDITGSDVEKNGVFCTGCDRTKDREKLIPLEEVDE